MMKNESGRSMVEMLGVLAIIGVLSVGGIAGYTMAMRKYKANEALSAAAQCAMMARSMNMGTGGTSCEGVDFTKTVTGLSGSVKSCDGTTAVIELTFPDKPTCEAANAIKSASSTNPCATNNKAEWTFS